MESADDLLMKACEGPWRHLGISPLTTVHRVTRARLSKASVSGGSWQCEG
jgi:hypothetical protein